MLLCYNGQDMVHGISKTPGLNIMGAMVRQEVFLVPEGKKKKRERRKEGWLTLPVIPRRPRYPLTHHEQDQELVTDHLERRRTHDQQQPGQHFQPAHGCLVVSRIWLVADQLQWKHLSKLLEQGSLRVAGNACQLCSSECSAWRHHRDHLCLSSAPLTKPQARSRLR